MDNSNHWVIFLSNRADKNLFIQQLLNKKAVGELAMFNKLNGVLFSAIAVKELIEEEERHEYVEVATNINRHLRSLSGGEQKKALLEYLLLKQPGFIIADNPFDNLDVKSKSSLHTLFQKIATDLPIIQIVNRTKDCLPFIRNAISINDDNVITYHDDIADLIDTHYAKRHIANSGQLPVSDVQFHTTFKPLILFSNVTVQYQEQVIVKDICWQIFAGEFWQLIGPNGSGKTTLLSLITGDNTKGYGQNIVLFGKRKGSGESVWSIKEKIGYFTANMIDLFSRHSSVEQMIISGFFDSVGLYAKPSDRQIKLAQQWLVFIGMLQQKNKPFHTLTLGQQRMVLIIRAMVKHPPLLILDEPTVGLDDENVSIITALINKISTESDAAILYVSHRKEEGLSPNFVYELTTGKNGSIGKVVQ
jgi:molybdate transport system ATP-binding protein